MLHITHIDHGVEPTSVEDVTGIPLEDAETGRWPKVSFSNGETLSWTFLTNTKILFFTKRNKELLILPDYERLIKEFFDSDREFDRSNWRSQPKRVSTWKPITVNPEREYA